MRGEVLDGGMGVRHSRRAPEVGEGVDVAALQRVCAPGVEVGRPARDRVVLHHVRAQEGQAVGHVAGADDEDALLAQGPEPAAEVHQPLRAVRRHAQLQDGDVRVRVHHLERHPGAVVEAAAGVLVDRLGVGHERGDAGGEGPGVGCRVGHLVVVLSEAAEVVDQGSAGTGRGEAQRRGLPVGADDEDGGRLRQGLAPREELSDPVRVVEDGRSAVAEVERGHRAVVRGPGPVVAAAGRDVAQEVVEGATRVVRGHPAAHVCFLRSLGGS